MSFVSSSKVCRHPGFPGCRPARRSGRPRGFRTAVCCRPNRSMAIAPVVILIPVGILFPAIFPSEFAPPPLPLQPMPLWPLPLPFQSFCLSLFLRLASALRGAKVVVAPHSRRASRFMFYASPLLVEKVCNILLARTEFGQFVCVGTNLHVVGRCDSSIFRNCQVKGGTQVG